jgi:hypothetical protein
LGTKDLLLLLLKVGSFIHGPFPLAEVIGAMVELQIGGAFFINITSWGQHLFHKKKEELFRCL